MNKVRADMEQESRFVPYVYLPVDEPEEEKDEAFDDVMRDIEEY